MLRIQQTTRYFYNKSIDKTAAPVISRRLFSHLFSFSRPVLSLHLVISLFLSYDMDKLNLQPRGDLCILTPGINGLRFFYLYCFFGWIFESTYVSLKQKRFVNRGFLRLPMLPLYGSGAVMMLWVSLPFQDSLILTYISGVIGATALEYVTGYVMERLFKVRYWDYSNQPFNLHGYICLSSSIAWGFLTIFMTHLIHKPIERAVLAMPLYWDLFFVFFVTVLFVYDSIICTKEALAFGKSLEAMQKLRAELDNLQVQRALLKMNAEDRLQAAKEELLDQIEAKRVQAAALTGMSIEEFREKAGTKFKSIKEKPAAGMSLIQEKAGAAADSIRDLSNVSLEELKAKAGGKLDSLKDLTGIHLEALRGKSAEQLAEMLKERESRLAALRKERRRFRKERIHSNPTAVSPKYAREFEELKKYFEDEGRNATPQ